MRFLTLCALLCLLAACSSATQQPLGQTSFAAYQKDTRAWLARHRHFQTPDHASEINWNLPQEWRPEGQPGRGILLVHGLGDSPWSFADLGPLLARQGFLVRTVLLPGHGTQPADLIQADIAVWRRLVREQTRLLAREVPQVYLGGFSTGANLVTEYALQHPEISGLLLMSPAFKSNNGIDWLAPWVSWAKPWLREPGPERAQQTPVRYLNTPTAGFAAFYRSSEAVQAALAEQSYDKPALLITTEHDSVIDVQFTLQAFQTRFTHPASRLIWYGALAEETPPRVLVRSDYLPEKRISQFSHMAVLFAAQNPLYGETGQLRLCWNGQDAAAQAQCLAGAPVWYSDWGYREPDKIHARLTFNPWFDWQGAQISTVLGAAPRQP